MNMHVSPTANVESPSVGSSFALDVIAVQQLPADEAVLIPLYEAYRAANEALISIYNKPRVKDEACHLIGEECERISSLACAVADKLSQIKTVKSFWREMYAETLLSHVFFTGGGMKEVIKIAAAANAVKVIDDRKS
jgi:hypothetical protein